MKMHLVYAGGGARLYTRHQYFCFSCITVGFKFYNEQPHLHAFQRESGTYVHMQSHLKTHAVWVRVLKLLSGCVPEIGILTWQTWVTKEFIWLAV